MFYLHWLKFNLQQFLSRAENRAILQCQYIVKLQPVMSLFQRYTNYQHHQLFHVDLRRSCCVCNYWIYGHWVQSASQLCH